MSVFFSPVAGSIALVLLVSLAGVAALAFGNVRFRHFSQRWLGFRLYEFGADLETPSPLRSRSYQIAVYFTMKALPRQEAAHPANAASPPSATRAPRVA